MERQIKIINMNDTKPVAVTKSSKMLTAMVGIGIICALLIVFTYEGTKPRIKKLKAEALEKAIFKVIPGSIKTKTFQFNMDTSLTAVNHDRKSKNLVYAGYNEAGKLMGVAIEARGQGYADILSILYGYLPETQTIIGFYVLESKETPGLGDKIEKDLDFLVNFNALDVSLVDDLSAIKNLVIPVKHGTKKNPWEVDGITGATISSRAIGNIIGTSTKQWIPHIYKNKDALIFNYDEQKSIK